jgi:hypothetical protein
MRGRVLLTAGERSVELRFTTNAICRLEEVSGRTISDFVRALDGNVSLRDVRMLVWVASGVAELDEAGAIIDDAGLGATVEAIGGALTAAFPDADGAAPGKMRPKAGTAPTALG